MTSGRRLLATVAALLAVAACSAAPPSVPLTGQLRVATGEQGGVYHTYGQALAQLTEREFPQVEVTVQATPASVTNLRMLADGSTDLAFTLADIAAAAYRGEPPFTAPTNLVVLGHLYDNYVHLVVPATSPVRAAADLRGLRVSTGAAGSGTQVVARRIMDVLGLVAGRDFTDATLGLEDSAAALRAGSIDAFFFTGGLPTPTIAELAATSGARIAPLEGLAEELTKRYGALYTDAVVPARSYGLDTPVATIRIPNYLVSRPDLDENVAYEVIRLLFTHVDELALVHPEARRLAVRSAVSTYPLPLHPGAARWYQQAPR